MLRDLLGQEDLRQLLDAVVVDETEAELQCLAEGYQARHPDGLHDVLRRVGDLDDAELAARCEGAPGPWLEELVRSGRALRVRVAGAGRWIAAEDVALYRDALGVVPPSGLPEALLTPVVQPLEQLLARFARTRGPFETRLPARRYDLLPAQLEPVLAGMEAQGRVQRGEFHPAGLGPEWCDPEVLRRMRRRTLARLRGEVAPVEASVLARFLPRWHGIAAVPFPETVESRGERSGSAERRLREALGQLEGVPLAFNELERVILPARVPGFDPRMLDERGALGELVWVGCGPLGERDGRIALYHRERIGLLLDVPSQESAGGRLEGAILAHLGERGACFFAELLQAVGHCGQDDLLEALRDLAWSGLLTNDTFAPLRALSARRRGRGRNAPALPTAAAGRWSLVRNLIDAGITPTERAHARALLLLERYGVVSRDVMALEATPGGFAAVYPVFKAMEESGKLRRGHFVDGLSGAQFAFAGAVDRLRAERRLGGDPLVTVLAATDPANPFGALLPWPTPRVENAGTPRRAAGATLVSVDGEPVLYLERGGRRALSFPAANDAGLAAHAAAALRRLVAGGRRRSLRIEWVDGEPASQAGALTQALRDAGFRPDYKGFVLERTAL